MFNFFKRKKNEVHTETILKQFIAMTLSDETLSMPVHLPEIQNEADTDNLGIGPLIYIWNVDHAAGTYRLSVNGKAVGYLLEPLIPRSDPSFAEVRDRAMHVILELSKSSVSAAVEKTGVMPDLLFARSNRGQ